MQVRGILEVRAQVNLSLTLKHPNSLIYGSVTCSDLPACEPEPLTMPGQHCLRTGKGWFHKLKIFKGIAAWAGKRQRGIIVIMNPFLLEDNTHQKRRE